MGGPSICAAEIRQASTAAHACVDACRALHGYLQSRSRGDRPDASYFASEQVLRRMRDPLAITGPFDKVESLMSFARSACTPINPQVWVFLDQSCSSLDEESAHALVRELVERYNRVCLEGILSPTNQTLSEHLMQRRHDSMVNELEGQLGHAVRAEHLDALEAGIASEKLQALALLDRERVLQQAVRDSILKVLGTHGRDLKASAVVKRTHHSNKSVRNMLRQLEAEGLYTGFPRPRPKRYRTSQPAGDPAAAR